MKIHIKNGRVIDPMSARDEIGDVFVAAGKIVGNGHAPADFHANRTLDATGLVVCPGLVDLSVRLREPGFEYKATLESEMLAAAAGGITSLACPPDTDPPLDEPGLVEMLKFRARNLPGPRVYPIGALTQKLEGTMLTEMAELTEAAESELHARGIHGKKNRALLDAVAAQLILQGFFDARLIA